jgi:multidrug efflux pump subunit AcrA (membrane-fusion protein)
MPRVIALARPLLIIAAGAAVAFVMIGSRKPLEARSVDMPLPLVAVQTVRKDTLPVTVVAHGNVRAWRQLELAAQVTGRILWQSPSFEPGMLVDAGEPLLRIDPTDYELALAEAKQALASAELSLADARALRQSARVDEAQATVDAARARIARAERDLRNTEISAPYAAVIDEQRVEVGQFIAAGTAVGRISVRKRPKSDCPCRRRISVSSTSTATPPSACTPSPASGSGAGRVAWHASRHALTSRRASSRWSSRSRSR